MTFFLLYFCGDIFVLTNRDLLLEQRTDMNCVWIVQLEDKCWKLRLDTHIWK